MYLLSHTASILASLALVKLGRAEGDTPNAISVFIPGYDEDQWSTLRGSIISVDEAANMTRCTIFCQTATQAACELLLEFPFIIEEGPSSLRFHGTMPSTYIANLECTMDGKTLATCSGSSSYASGYSNGKFKGPTEVSWTTTYSNVHWGTLTLAEAPAQTIDDSLAVTATNIAAPSAASSPPFYVKPTGTSRGNAMRINREHVTAIVALHLISVFLTFR